MPLLDLSGADTSGFGAIPGGTYDAVIFAAAMKETKGPTENNPNAALPKGTPMINVQFKIIGGTDSETGVHESGDDYKYNNRRVFRQYVIPPAKIGNKPYEHAARLKGMLVRFLEAAGYSKEELESDEFDLQVEDLAGRPVRVTVSKKVKYGVNAEADDFDPSDDENFDNDVTGVKAPTEMAAGASGLT